MPYLFGRYYSKDELLRSIGNMDQVAGIRLMENGDGPERGGRVLHVWTGTGLYFHVLADRSMDISTCRYRGASVVWLSSTGEMHPAFSEPEGMRWLRTFPGGLLATCGLDHFGPPVHDAGEEFGLHGRVGNVPARAVNYSTGWEGDEYLLTISGQVRQTRVFGENLVLRRRITARLGSNEIQIEDAVTNEGFAPAPHMIMYHFNLGFPLITPATQLHLNAAETHARDADAQAGLAEWRALQPPTPGFREQVFRHVPVVDSDGMVRVGVANPDIGLALRLTYDATNLPYLVQWKMMGEGMYVMGIEPVNCAIVTGRAVAREQGVLPHLAPGETRTYRLSVEVGEEV
jgi:hypothetical protein